MTCDAGSAPNAGAAERRLAATIAGADELEITKAAQGWRSASEILFEVKNGLIGQADALEKDKTLSKAGPAAAVAYRRIADQVQKRIDEVNRAAGALVKASTAITEVKNTQLSPAIGAFSPGGLRAEGVDLIDMRKAHQSAQTSRLGVRDQESQAALTKLDTELEGVAVILREITGERTPDRFDPQQKSATTPSAAPTPTHVISGPTKQPPVYQVTPVKPPTTIVEPIPVQPEPVWPGPNDTDDPGPKNPIDPVRPTSPTVQAPTGPISAPTPGSPVPGAVTGIGAGVVSTGAALAATRSGVPLRGLTPGTPAQLGRSAAKPGSSTLGRPGMTPGQSATARPATSGARGTGAGSRAGLAPGQSGTRGAAGRRGPVAAAGTGGRRGKRDERGEDRDALTYADDESWLGEEEAGGAVLD
ncbi:hypothetical protein NODU109028_01105 [Nocardioides dubius]|uniref:Uncharacterized protein n=1 Tax=Nocardioides dubius TaxID=317019 RepID=A0ABP4EFB3_9ACTN